MKKESKILFWFQFSWKCYKCKKKCKCQNCRKEQEKNINYSQLKSSNIIDIIDFDSLLSISSETNKKKKISNYQKKNKEINTIENIFDDTNNVQIKNNDLNKKNLYFKVDKVEDIFTKLQNPVSFSQIENICQLLKNKFNETYKKCIKYNKLNNNSKCNLCNLLIETADEISLFSCEKQMTEFIIYLLINFPHFQIRENKQEYLQKITDCIMNLKYAQNKSVKGVMICKSCLIKIINTNEIVNIIKSIFNKIENNFNQNENKMNKESKKLIGNNSFKIDVINYIIVDEKKNNNNEINENNHIYHENNNKFEKKSNYQNNQIQIIELVENIKKNIFSQLKNIINNFKFFDEYKLHASFDNLNLWLNYYLKYLYKIFLSIQKFKNDVQSDPNKNNYILLIIDELKKAENNFIKLQNIIESFTIIQNLLKKINY